MALWVSCKNFWSQGSVRILSTVRFIASLIAGRSSGLFTMVSIVSRLGSRLRPKFPSGI